MEILELKNNQYLKNKFIEYANSSLDTNVKRIHKLQDRTIEIIQTETESNKI